MGLGKVVLVIGGCHGIGAGIVESMAKKGYIVIFSYRSRKNEAIALQNRLCLEGLSVKAVYGNFVAESHIENFLKGIRDIDILIVNAAINHKNPFLSYSVKEFEGIMKNNLFMPFLFCQKMAKIWADTGKKGRVIFISSIRGETPQIGRLGYCCSKASLNMLTRCAAYELATYGITVNAIAVGLTGLGMNEHLELESDTKWKERGKKIPLGRMGQGKDIGNTVAFLADEESDWITGQIITVDGGHLLRTF